MVVLLSDSAADNKIALSDSNNLRLSYAQLRDYCAQFLEVTKLEPRSLVLQLCDNTVQSAAFFFGCLQNRVVPLMINSSIDENLLSEYISIYRPEFVYSRHNELDLDGFSTVSVCHGYEVLRCDSKHKTSLHNTLSLLLPTSGSTGSPKLVRHSYENIYESAKNVAAAFDLTEHEHSLLTLPLYFTQGLSVLCSSIYAGASVFLTDYALTDKDFWNVLKNEGITSYSGVPYSYEILDKLRFFKMELPFLKKLNQGGGRLSDELWAKIARYAKDTNRKFYASYGATETTARMSLLPPEYAANKTCSIGEPFKDYEMWLEDSDGFQIKSPNTSGELIFKGKNVTLGYAESADDLQKGDERNGVYRTGDIAYRDEDGFFYIVGRLGRFVKIFGLRISLDEVERLVSSKFGSGFACTGDDERVIVCTTRENVDFDSIRIYLKDKLKINISAFCVVSIDEIPKNKYGKTNYNKLKEIAFRSIINE